MRRHAWRHIFRVEMFLDLSLVGWRQLSHHEAEVVEAGVDSLRSDHVPTNNQDQELSHSVMSLHLGARNVV